MTILEVLTAATAYLGEHGVESPRLNAEHLLAHVLGKKRLDLYLEFDRPLSDDERAPLRDLVRSRSRGIPLQHLLGTAEFHGRTFRCDARALIPRPETEQLVDLVLSSVGRDGSPSRPTSLLDVGAGTGCIAITLALEFPEAAIHATDHSPGALALARENAESLGVPDRITFHEADLLPPGDEKFGLIVANLPYIPTDAIPQLSREVRRDPVSALDGGPDGLVLIGRLIAAAPARMHPGAHLFLEIGHDQAARVAELLTRHGYDDIRIEPDLQGAQRFAIGKQGAATSSSPSFK